MIVVDTNIIAYALIEGDKTPLARQVVQKDPNWKVPLLWRHEFLNVLATATRAEVIGIDQAESLWQSALDLLIAAEVDVPGTTALRLAVEHSISAYDAQYIALAQSLDVFCITEDRRLVRAFPDTALSMAAFIDRINENSESD